MTIDERIEALVKGSEEQRKSIDGLVESTKNLEATAKSQSAAMDKILEGFREFKEDRWHLQQSLRTLIERVDRIGEKIDRQTDNIDRLERFFERSLTKPPNGKTKGGEKK